MTLGTHTITVETFRSKQIKYLVRHGRVAHFNDVTAADVHVEAVGVSGRAMEVDLLRAQMLLTLLHVLGPRRAARVRL